MTLYVNGSVSTTATFAGPVTLLDNALDLRLGADSNGQHTFDGLLDQLTLYDQALTPAQGGGLGLPLRPRGRRRSRWVWLAGSF
jgi:hypothetical protein